MSDFGLLLKHISKRIDLTCTEEEEFVSILSETVIQKKKHLIQPGDSVHQMYYVVKGCLKAYYQDELGNTHILQFAAEDWWITDFDALQNRIPAKLYIEAIEDCTLLGVHTDAWEELYQRVPKFERFFRLLFTNAFIALRKRMMSSLQKNSKERYMEFCLSYPNLEKRVTNYHIANYLGITAESLSRIRREIDE